MWEQPTALHLSVCVLANLERLAVRLMLLRIPEVHEIG